MQIRYYPNREKPRPRRGSRFFGAIELKPSVPIEIPDEDYQKISTIPTYQRLLDEGVIEEIVTKKPSKRTRTAKKVVETKPEPEKALESEKEESQGP